MRLINKPCVFIHECACNATFSYLENDVKNGKVICPNCQTPNNAKFVCKKIIEIEDIPNMYKVIYDIRHILEVRKIVSVGRFRDYCIYHGVDPTIAIEFVKQSKICGWDGSVFYNEHFEE